MTPRVHGGVSLPDLWDNLCGLGADAPHRSSGPTVVGCTDDPHCCFGPESALGDRYRAEGFRRLQQTSSAETADFGTEGARQLAGGKESVRTVIGAFSALGVIVIGGIYVPGLGYQIIHISGKHPQ